MRREEPRLVDFQKLVTRLFWTAVVLGAVAVTGATIQGLVSGLTFAVLLQWGALFALALVVIGAGLLAVHAIGGAKRARARGERLTSEGVGLVPPRGQDHGGEDRGGERREA